MRRPPEKSIHYKAGLLSFAVHGILLAILLLSVNWQSKHVVSVAEVELWDSLPNVAPPVKPPPVKLPEPIKPPEPTPIKVPEPTVTAKPDIVLEKKTVPKIEKPIEKPKEKIVEKPVVKESPPKDLLKQLEALEQQEAQKEALRKLQADVAGDANQPQKSQASAGEVDQYKAAIMRKIQANVNKSLCGSGNPTLTFDIALTPTGELQTAPKLAKSSGMTACDEAVERAILQSEPLPMPTEASLRGQFKNITLQFKPNQ